MEKSFSWMAPRHPEAGITKAYSADKFQIDSVAVESISRIFNREERSVVSHMLNKTARGLKLAYQFQHPTQDELIFGLFKSAKSENEASFGKLLSVLRSFGIREDDPRLKLTIKKMREYELKIMDECDIRHCLLTKEQFKECVRPSINLISQALRNDLIIPCWGEFILKMEEIYEACRSITEGNVAKYIPQLARQDPNKWGVSLCTIDGQRVSFGDYQHHFCFQSVSKAFNYAIVSSDLGGNALHEYVGLEPSGRLFNEICLDSRGKPHNPMINAGAIIVTSLIKNKLEMADRYDFVLTEYKKLAGGAYIGFNNATFLSERHTADRNYAIAHYMKENNCFPENTRSLREELDFYFQLCSLEANCESAAVMAATLANGGVCPLTNEKCIEAGACRDVLSLMYSCGMYDYSGQFAFHVGLPAKSGVSGAMIVVVPNLMGICLWSPPLDKLGNTTRGVSFCKKLIEFFNFHNYDSLLHTDSEKIDPRRKVTLNESEIIVELMFASKTGDLDSIRRMFLGGIDLNLCDYDGRTPLHLAACEGHEKIIDFFTEVSIVKLNPKDRWGKTPQDDAIHFGFKVVAEKLANAIIAREKEKNEEKLADQEKKQEEPKKVPEGQRPQFSLDSGGESSDWENVDRISQCNGSKPRKHSDSTESGVTCEEK